jgi:hypothetical protein
MRAKIEPIKTLAFGGISGSYAAVGDPLEHPGRLVHISNNTEGDMLFSIDGIDDNIFVAAGNYAVYDIQTNRKGVHEDYFALAVGTQFYVKQITAPASGSVYITVFYSEAT